MISILEFSDDLEQHLNGKADASYLREKYRNSDNSDISLIMCSVEHFLSDSDIRSKDIRYRKMQEDEMIKLILYLRSGKFDDARLISFLHKSNAI